MKVATYSSTTNSARHKLLVVELEPAPYKYDLWNEFAKCNWCDVNVLFTTAKNWAPDGGHNFQDLPVARFSFKLFRGKGIRSLFSSTRTLIRQVFGWKPDFVFISGYVDLVPLIAIILCIILKIKYSIHSDIFNNDPPGNHSDYFKHLLRKLLRTLIFRTSEAVLTCGKLGYDSAIVAGCPEGNIHDFPYVVDPQRLLTDKPTDVPDICRIDLDASKIIILFSGRLIQRKGLDTLLSAVSLLHDTNNWVLWIEGDGPLLSEYRIKAKLLGIDMNCRFLGFSQMALHSWLLRNSDIVVVPSLIDSWGIVVDEGMQLGKVVITSDATGSGADRIIDGVNGLLFRPTNHRELADKIRMLMIKANGRITLGNNAKRTAAAFGPRKNVETVYGFLNIAENVKEHV